ncbi:hypothetical protein HEK616_37380 [Streptomyces nigrescens]|uniref:Transposase Helix-turn-helix domain-containing protein n=1 Tax=Streptomyces nigrescens TaxID=1920 RepID=A0ABM7ZV65_STRNI|nr:hypothetical protein HEK616_37380 [Streptomyces nigrescens]
MDCPWRTGLVVTAYWRTNMTMHQLAPLFGISKSSADRSPTTSVRSWCCGLGAALPDAVLIVDGTLVPTRDHTVAEPSKNYRYSTNHQAVIDADTRRAVVVGPAPARQPKRLQGVGALGR